MVECFSYLSTDSLCRCILFTSTGPVFTSGLDLSDAAQSLFTMEGEDTARKAMILKTKMIKPFQDTFTSIEKVSIVIIVINC